MPMITGESGGRHQPKVESDPTCWKVESDPTFRVTRYNRPVTEASRPANAAASATSSPAPPPQNETWREALFNRRMLICVFTGFSSGLPLYLLINLLPAWLRSEGANLKEIGLFALIGFPYTWKFLWSPLVDRYAIPWLGRRRGWMFVTHVALIASIAGFGLFRPQTDLWSIAYLAAAVAFFSATLDIAIDAFRRELLPEVELGLGNSIHVNAYRISSLIPGSLSLILADRMPWASVFLVTALFMLPGLAMTLMVREPAATAAAPKTLRDAVVEPFREFINRAGWSHALLILTFIFLYKLGDSMATALATPFYLDMGFTKTQIGIVAKNAGLWASVFGGMLGGLWMVRIGINRGLWLFGVVQVVSILGFAWLAWLGKPDIVALGVVIAFEALGVGLGTVAYVAFIARATNPRFTATQFALFTSLSAVPRTVVNATTGWIVDQTGWFTFFLLCAVLALPGMALLLRVAPWKEPAK
jgi:PAT family beta-lactamase induction signal transducer AmpG